MQLIDVHCHLNSKDFDLDRAQVLEEAKAIGVTKIIDSGETIKENEKALANAALYPQIFASFGFDPCNLKKREAKMMRDYIRENKGNIVAIGEVGLDYWKVKENKDRETQKNIFRSFIDLAMDIGRPLIVHSRSAGKYALEILIEKGASKVCMHAFDGSATNAQAGGQAGYYFSIPPSIVRSQQKQKLVERIPLENLLLESDTPMLGPVKGEKNTPENIVVAAEKIAEIKETTVEEVAEKTTRNAEKLFNLAGSGQRQSEGPQSKTPLRNG